MLALGGLVGFSSSSSWSASMANRRSGDVSRTRSVLANKASLPFHNNAIVSSRIVTMLKPILHLHVDPRLRGTLLYSLGQEMATVIIKLNLIKLLGQLGTRGRGRDSVRRRKRRTDEVYNGRTVGK